MLLSWDNIIVLFRYDKQITCCARVLVAKWAYAGHRSATRLHAMWLPLQIVVLAGWAISFLAGRGLHALPGREMASDGGIILIVEYSGVKCMILRKYITLSDIYYAER